jgi:transcriptional regulator with PAS, ATPase and Fis domain
MGRTVAKLRRVARLDTTVLLTGDSGTGKEVAARFLHDHHPRRASGPFVCVHCGAIPDALLESELFGHVKGAFTGADRDRTGKFEQASGGTLFLDEISTMKPEAQIRLLRVLQTRQVSRLGAPESKAVDVRVVVATNRNVKEMIAQGTFRLDLYYRINTFPVEIPPLRERIAEIPELAALLARRVAERLELNAPKRLSSAALAKLVAYDWPGNVRELENAVEYASILAEEREVIDAADLPPDVLGSEGEPAAPGRLVTAEGVSLRTAVGNLERDLILQSLRLAEGNKARAAELLDLKRTTFLEKLRRLEDEGFLPAAQADWSRDPAASGGTA